MVKYVDYEFYKTLYGEKSILETDFNRLSWDACKRIDTATTTANSIKKLKIAFPTNEEDAEAVKRCLCELINISYKLERAEERVNASQGFVQREDGTVSSKLVSSISAGNESISYSTTNNTSAATLIDKALSDKTAQEQLYRDTITKYLSGVTDKNGINLLYAGRYPEEFYEN